MDDAAADDLPPLLAERLLAYDEATSAGTGDSVQPASLAAQDQVRLARGLACVDLLHRAWADDAQRGPLSNDSLSAKVLGDFRLIREIGRGGMGVVYEAEQLSLRRRVALKVLPFGAFANQQHLRRFTNEARAAATLQHPHIVPVYSVDCANRVRFYSMRYIDGPNLAEVLDELRGESRESRARSAEQSVPSVGQKVETLAIAPGSTWKAGGTANSLPDGERVRVTEPCSIVTCVRAEYGRSKMAYFRTAARWGVQLAQALAYAHQNGVLHRDIKPANILLDSSGHPWITDFGLARLMSEATLTTTGDLLGTLRYMAPEQALGKRAAVDHRADIYSLGMTLYELLALRPAFAGRDREELLRQIAFDEPRPLRRIDRAIPLELDVIVRKAASKIPSDRYGSAQDLADDLQRFLDHKPIRAKPPGIIERSAKWTRRRPAAAALVAVSCFAFAALWAGTLWHARTLSTALHESEQNRQKAVASEQQSLERERSLQNYQYAWRMKVAGDAWDAKNTPLLRDMLSPQPNEGEYARLRGFEWHYLWNLAHPKSWNLAGHKKIVSSVAWSPDDKLLATGSEDGTVRIWNTQSQMLVATLDEHTSCVNQVAFAPDGTWLATSSCDHTVKTWDLSTFRAANTFGPHENAVFGLAISPDGKTIAAGLGRGELQLTGKCDIVLWDVATGKRTHVLSGHQHDVRSLAFAPDGTLVTASFDGTVRFWNPATGELIRTLEQPGDLYCVKYSQDGTMLVTASNSGTAIIWDQSDWKPKTMVHTNTYLYSVAISPDNATLATGNANGWIELWDAATGAPKATLLACNDQADGNNRVVSLAFSRDGDHLASGSASSIARVWDLRQEPGVETILTLRPDSQYAFVAVDSSLSNVYALDVSWTVDQLALSPTGHAQRLRQYNTYTEPMPPAKILTVAPQRAFVATNAPAGKLEILNAKTGKRVAMLSDERGGFLIAEFLQDDRTLLGIVDCSGERGPAWSGSVWNALDGGLIYQLPRYAGKLTALATHPDRNLFAIGAGNVAEVYDLSTGTRLAQLSGSAKTICDLKFSPNGTLLAAVCHDDIARVWDWAHQTELHESIGGYGAILSCIAFSPDGRTFGSGEVSGLVRLWNTESGYEMLRLPIRGQPARLQFSSDGKRLACWTANAGASGQHEVRVWSIEH